MNNELKQKFYKYVTTPIARVLDFINIPKRIKLAKKREMIAIKNRNDYIETTAKLLLDKEIQDNLNKGLVPHPLLLPVLIAKKIDEAIDMYKEKKELGYFDELNVMIK